MRRLHEAGEAGDRRSGDGEYARLNRRIADLEQVVSALSLGRDEQSDRPQSDAMWKCRKCGSLLAFYDRGEDVLRIRYKEHLTYVHVGVGGWVQVVCKSCGEPNIQTYATEEEVAETQSEVDRALTRRKPRPPE